MKNKAANEIQDFLVFGEFGDVNPSIGDASTYTFLSADAMEEAFHNDKSENFFYSRHRNPTNKYLATALARMEGAESAQVTSSGMAAISSTLLAICSANDEILAGPTIYGGTYALLSNLFPKWGITTKFININDLNEVKSSISTKTKVLYIETISNPLLEIADIQKLAVICKNAAIKLVVDNTFAPLLISPIKLGADVVVYSMTKFINGTSDCVAGSVISSTEFIAQLTNVESGTSMLLGPVLDSARAASILKNMHSLHIRMRQHSKNALFIAENFQSLGIKTYYPGLASHTGHELMNIIANSDYGFGGIVTVDLGTKELANEFMLKLQRDKVGYFAVSLGYFKTLFCAPSHSTSSEMPEEFRSKIGLSPGLVRLSIGLDEDIARSWGKIASIIKQMEVIKQLDSMAV